MGSSMSHVIAPRPQPSSGLVGLYVVLLPKEENMVENKKYGSSNFLCLSRSQRTPRRAGSNEEGQGTKEEIDAPYSPILMAELDRILNEIHYTVNFTWRIPKHIVSVFVDTVEEADQYFDLKKYLREECPFVKYDSSEDHIYNHIVEVQRQHNRFNKVNEAVVKSAVEERISELKDEQTVHMEYKFKLHLRVCDSIKWGNNITEILESQDFQKKFPGLSDIDIKQGLLWYTRHYYRLDTSLHRYQNILEKRRQMELRLLLKGKDEDLYANSFPVFNLVFRARKKEYVLDPNPEVELAKIIRRDHRLSNEMSMRGPMENLSYQARTVIVKNVSLNASVHDIQQLFSISGDIEDAKMNRWDKSQTAFVTFKYFEGAESALLLQDTIICDLPVIIKSTLGYQQRKAISTHLMSKDVKAPNNSIPPMKNCEYPSRSLDEAVITRYSQMLSKFAAAVA